MTKTRNYINSTNNNKQMLERKSEIFRISKILFEFRSDCCLSFSANKNNSDHARSMS